MAGGSYIRFFIGLILSLEVIRQLIMGNHLSNLASILAGIYLLLAMTFFLFRF